jgi:hypothetical protein
MKPGLSLQELAREIERRANAKADVVASTSNMAMESGAGGMHLHVGNKFDYRVNKIAHEQIATHVDIPRKYYDRMLIEAPHLLADNVNEWFKKYPAERMVRTLDGVARAFPSNSYRPLEHEDLAQAVLPPILEMDLDVMSSQITDRKLYIKCVDKKVTRELEAKGGKWGDGKHNIIRMLFPAITISNSEVSEGALSILGGVYDGGCSNLATFGERSLRKYHVGKRHELGEDTYALLSDESRRKSDVALWAAVGDVVRAAFDRARFDSLCDKIAETAEQPIEGDPVKVVKLSARRFGFNEQQETDVLKHLIEGGSLTRFGLYNAVTRMAQDVEDYDDASTFERAGAQVVELPANEWKELARAA